MAEPAPQPRKRFTPTPEAAPVDHAAEEVRGAPAGRALPARVRRSRALPHRSRAVPQHSGRPDAAVRLRAVPPRRPDAAHRRLRSERSADDRRSRRAARARRSACASARRRRFRRFSRRARARSASSRKPPKASRFRSCARTRAGDENLTVEKLTSDASPVIRLVDSMVFTALQRRASDIHIETQDDAVHVKYRIDGVLQQAMKPIDKRYHSTIISRIKVMAELDIAEKRVPQDGRFKLRVRGKTIDFRVSIMPSVHGEDAVIRILDKESMSEQFTELRLDILGWPEDRDEAVPEVHPRAVRHGARHRPDRQRQDDDALRGAVGDQDDRRQDHHDRRPGRIPAARHHADSDQREEGADVRARPAVDPAPRPRQDHGRRNPRPGDRADRDSVGADGPPRVHDRPRQQRHRRARPLPEHGRRAVSVRVGAQLRAGAAARAPHLRSLQAAGEGHARAAHRVGDRSGAGRHARRSTRAPAASSAAARASRAARPSAS